MGEMLNFTATASGVWTAEEDKSLVIVGEYAGDGTPRFRGYHDRAVLVDAENCRSLTAAKDAVTRWYERNQAEKRAAKANSATRRKLDAVAAITDDTVPELLGRIVRRAQHDALKAVSQVELHTAAGRHGRSTAVVTAARALGLPSPMGSGVAASAALQPGVGDAVREQDREQRDAAVRERGMLNWRATHPSSDHRRGNREALREVLDQVKRAGDITAGEIWVVHRAVAAVADNLGVSPLDAE
jgi:hypothetical protein